MIVYMDITKKSTFLIDHFSKDSCDTHIQSAHNTSITDTLNTLYDDICSAYRHVHKHNEHPVISVNEINTVQEIPFPKKFPASSFPNDIRKHIELNSHYDFLYKTKQYGRNISFHFVTETFATNHMELYIEYSKNMLAWLYIVNQYASTKCSKDIVVYLYMTKLEKRMPQSNLQILGENHINTAFTTTCPVDSEIVIFRKEEWFKVFIHETFHNFALDFSDMNMTECNKKILSIFPVKSDVNLFESYTEFWAEIVNICFVSYFTCENHTNRNDFLAHCHFYIELETKFTCFQMAKMLGFMGLTYENLHKKTSHADTLRSTLYKEDTNVLSYYVIKSILLTNYPAFMNWCISNNTSMIQFKKTTKNLAEFCNFIKSHYKSRNLIHLIDCEESHLSKMIKKRPRSVKKKRETSYLLNTARMTLCELS